MTMKKDVMIVTGAGQIGMAIARRVGFGKKIILGDKNLKNAEMYATLIVIVLIGILVQYGILNPIEKNTVRKWGMSR